MMTSSSNTHAKSSRQRKKSSLGSLASCDANVQSPATTTSPISRKRSLCDSSCAVASPTGRSSRSTITKRTAKKSVRKIGRVLDGAAGTSSFRTRVRLFGSDANTLLFAQGVNKNTSGNNNTSASSLASKSDDNNQQKSNEYQRKLSQLLESSDDDSILLENVFTSSKKATALTRQKQPSALSSQIHKKQAASQSQRNRLSQVFNAARSSRKRKSLPNSTTAKEHDKYPPVASLPTQSSTNHPNDTSSFSSDESPPRRVGRRRHQHRQHRERHSHVGTKTTGLALITGQSRSRSRSRSAPPPVNRSEPQGTQEEPIELSDMQPVNRSGPQGTQDEPIELSDMEDDEENNVSTTPIHYRVLQSPENGKEIIELDFSSPESESPNAENSGNHSSTVPSTNHGPSPSASPLTTYRQQQPASNSKESAAAQNETTSVTTNDKNAMDTGSNHDVNLGEGCVDTNALDINAGDDDDKQTCRRTKTSLDKRQTSSPSPPLTKDNNNQTKLLTKNSTDADDPISKTASKPETQQKASASSVARDLPEESSQSPINQEKPHSSRIKAPTQAVTKQESDSTIASTDKASSSALVDNVTHVKKGALSKKALRRDKKYKSNEQDLGSLVFVEFGKGSYPAFVVLDLEQDGHPEMISNAAYVHVQWVDRQTREEVPKESIRRNLEVKIESEDHVSNTATQRKSRRRRAKPDYLFAPTTDDKSKGDDKETNDVEPHEEHEEKWDKSLSQGKKQPKCQAAKLTKKQHAKNPVKEEPIEKKQPNRQAAKSTKNHYANVPVKQEEPLPKQGEDECAPRAPKLESTMLEVDENTRVDNAEASSSSTALPPKRKYPWAGPRDMVVNRTWYNKPKPARPRRPPPPPPEIGSRVYLVDQESYDRGVAIVGEFYQRPRARVVGESIFMYGSDHERLLQLQCDDTGHRWYVEESKVYVPHFMER